MFQHDLYQLKARCLPSWNKDPTVGGEESAVSDCRRITNCPRDYFGICWLGQGIVPEIERRISRDPVRCVYFGVNFFAPALQRAIPR